MKGFPTATTAPRKDRNSAKHRISVSVRLKPASSQASAGPTISANSRGVVTPQKVFEAVDSVVTGCDQVEAFDAIASPLLARLRDGYSCTLLAYGQTGSGKTHTMFGPPGALTEASLADSSAAGAGCPPTKWGIFPRIALELLLNSSGSTLHASAIEVYQDSAYDLLADRAPLQVGSKSVGRQVGSGGAIIANASSDVSAGSEYGGVHPNHCQCGKCFKRQEKEREEREARRNARLFNQTTGCFSKAPPKRATQGSSSSSSSRSAEQFAAAAGASAFATVGEKLVPLTSPVEVARFSRTIELTRTAVGHALNARSSRSHCLVHLYSVERNGRTSEVCSKQLLFVDLAGSERILKTGVEGVAAAQAMAINGSLTALGKVIRALASNATHVPYRDSMLTMLLRSSLEGGRAATSVVVNVASDLEHTDETVCSLEFGERMGAVKTAATKVVAQRGLDAASAGALRDELKALRAEVSRMESQGLDAGSFHESAVPSEVRSLKHNIRRHAQHAAVAKELRARLAEGGGSRTNNHAGGGSGRGGLNALREKLTHEEVEAANLHNIIEMQKTIPVVRGSTSTMWLGPNREYTAAVGRVKAIEDALAFS
jgi:hypothetical protein